MNTQSDLGGLARILISENLLDEAQALSALPEAQSEGLPLARYLVKRQMLDGAAVAAAAARAYSLPLLDLNAFDPACMAMERVDPKLIRKHQALPLVAKAKRLFLAVSDPANEAAIADIQFYTGCKIELVVVEDHKLSHAIDALLESTEESLSSLGALEDVGLEDLNVEVVERETEDDAREAADETPIMRFVNKILLDANKAGASDIHIEPYEKIYRVRFRQDGMLKEIARPPLNIANRVCARLKIMSQMDISEKRIPQDGRIKLKLSRTKAIDFRVNTLPTLWGEKIVLRLLDPGGAQLGIDALGCEPEQKALYLEALHRRQGLILVTGPTGSGKTVSLYCGLHILNTHERNISTAEDPVELNLEGINQVAVNPKVGLDFATALRAFLRQDPDVVMVGEIRDLETAEIAIKAAQTGHLVLSTLHTNSASETLTRLRNMGIPAYNIATSVALIIAQRLARRLCTYCRKTVTLPPDILRQEGFNERQLQNLELYGAAGCDRCSEGYRGRVGIYEMVPVTESLTRLIMVKGNSMQIADQARAEGFSDLRTSALDKVAQGLTSLAEANRIA